MLVNIYSTPSQMPPPTLPSPIPTLLLESDLQYCYRAEFPTVFSVCTFAKAVCVETTLPQLLLAEQSTVSHQRSSAV